MTLSLAQLQDGRRGDGPRPRLASRLPGPRVPAGELNLQPPPEVPRSVPPSLLHRLLPLVMVVAMVGMVTLMVMTGGRNLLSNPMTLMFPMMMVMSMVGMYGGARGSDATADLAEQRRDYLRYLDALRGDVSQTRQAQRDALRWSHPDPVDLFRVPGTRRMWERRPGDHDFGHVRIGLGAHRLATRLIAPETAPVEDLDPVCALALRRFISMNSIVPELPTAVSVQAFAGIAVTGPGADDLTRAMLLSLAHWHGPETLGIAIVSGNPERWDWAKWLPHVQHSAATDGAGTARMLYPTLADCGAALDEVLRDRGRFSRAAETTARQFVIIIDADVDVSGDHRLCSEGGIDGVCLIDLTGLIAGGRLRRTLHLELSTASRGPVLGARTAFGVEDFGVPDAVTSDVARAMAMRLAQYRRVSAADISEMAADLTAGDPGLLNLLALGDAASWVPERGWRQRVGRHRLRVPVGYTATGVPVDIDLKEAAEGGMGPHGLCVGATGSGKSEFLRTLVLALVATHPPSALNLILVDFKGGATFLGLDELPHVAAVITNLEAELSLVDRMADALNGELNRRQELLRAAGNFANVGEYENARLAGAPLDPLPALFIVVDEFSELLAQKPEFADLFVAIGRLGRSLRMHLLLASQRLDEGRLRGLDSHLSYRIGLKTFSANESRSVLGVPDAYHLPSDPGSAYLKCDSGDPLRFSTCYVSGPYHPARSDAGPDVALGSGRLRFFTGAPVVAEAPDPLPVPTQPDEAPTQSVLRVTVGAITARLPAQYGPAAHEVWLPPLSTSATVDQLVAGWTVQPLRIPVGLIDRPYEQRRDVLAVDLAGAAGHVAIVGGPRSGKSTALQTLVLSATATVGPRALQFYCIDWAGGTLAALAGLPSVGAVYGRSDLDGVRRTIAELSLMVRQRVEAGYTSLGQLRRELPDVALVIDGYGQFRTDNDDLDTAITELVAHGLAVGIHVIVAANRWAEIRPAVKDLIGSRVELRLGDPLDSEAGRRAASAVPEGKPGRGITASGLHTLIALPRLDGQPDTGTLPTALAAAVSHLATQHPQATAPRVRVLPSTIARADIGADGVVLGLGERELAAVRCDFGAQPHLLIIGDSGAGKTAALRTLLRDIIGDPAARVLLVDFRRTLLGQVPPAQLAGYAGTTEQLGGLLTSLTAYLGQRLPPADITPAQLRARDWWSGPDIYLVVDDYDLVATSAGNPLHAMVELFAQARDIGLRVIIARRSGGIGRALFDPVLGRLKDLGRHAAALRRPRRGVPRRSAPDAAFPARPRRTTVAQSGTRTHSSGVEYRGAMTVPATADDPLRQKLSAPPIPRRRQRAPLVVVGVVALAVAAVVVWGRQTPPAVAGDRTESTTLGPVAAEVPQQWHREETATRTFFVHPDGRRIVVVQNAVRDGSTLESVAASLRGRISQRGDGVVARFAANVRVGERTVITYTEQPTSGAAISWYVQLLKNWQVSVGCQGGDSNADIEKLCVRVVESLHLR